jgi:signal peptidase I
MINLNKIKLFFKYFAVSKSTLVEIHSTYLYFRPFIWFIFINEFIFDFYLLEGESMMPTFDPYGNIVIVEKISVNNFLRRNKKLNFEKGEIVCAVNPLDREMKICKRVLYNSGESVRLKNGDIIQIPENHIWIEGDNKQNSMDSRRFGPIPKTLILGRVPIQIWPKIKIL